MIDFEISLWYTIHVKQLHGKDFGYPLMDLVEAYVYRSAFSVDWERHALWEIHHVLSGTIVYEFDDAERVELQGGTFLAIPPHVQHRTLNGSAAPSTRLSIRWLPERPGRRRNQSPLFLSKREIATIFTGLEQHGLRPRTMSNDMLRSAKELFNAINKADGRLKGLSAAIMRHRCNDLLLHLALSNLQHEPLPKSANVVDAMRSYMDAHLDKRLQMEDLVRISGYGATQLTKLFHEQAGLTPNGYLIRARVKRAQELLVSGDLPLTEIALMCGFPSAAYFSTVFRKYCGTSPRAWRIRNVSH